MDIYELADKPKTVVVDFLKDRDVSFRITKEDDQSFILTRDFNPDRINLEIKKGLVKNVYLG